MLKGEGNNQIESPTSTQRRGGGGGGHSFQSFPFSPSLPPHYTTTSRSGQNWHARRRLVYSPTDAAKIFFFSFFLCLSAGNRERDGISAERISGRGARARARPEAGWGVGKEIKTMVVGGRKMGRRRWEV